MDTEAVAPVTPRVVVESTVTPAEGAIIEDVMEQIVADNAHAIESWRIEGGEGFIVWKQAFVHIAEAGG